jgi:hypothetical protein
MTIATITSTNEKPALRRFGPRVGDPQHIRSSGVNESPHAL